MATVVVDAVVLKKMFLSGAKNLELNKEWINELNVFPVPDGDTGTNMTLTIMSAAREVQGVEEPTMEKISKAISSGSLRGARGNSGVILSQLFRGFCKRIQGEETLTNEIFAEAFSKAIQTAYKAVMKPKEGTILTVAKGMADKAEELADKNLDSIEMLRQVLDEGNRVLQKTPEMLPVLKEAGVVDSGGQGLMVVLEGCYSALIGKPLDIDIEASKVKPDLSKVTTEQKEISTADIKFGYCTEFIVNLEKTFGDKEEQEFKDYLLSLGDSLVLVSDDEIVKVHVHTNDPGLAIQKGLSFGSLSKMKIDNMREEHQEKLIKDAEKIAKEQLEQDTAKKQAPRVPYGFISVSIGAGIDDIFKELHVDYLISGGQTMNPSTEDMLEAIDKVNADTIFILPNNKNIILAAEQAANLTEDKKIIVIPSKSIPQGIAAVLNFLPEASPEENAASMAEEMANVKTGQVTYAVRNTSIDGKEIHEGDMMGIDDHSIVAVGQELNFTTLELLEHMIDEDSELISIYYGEGVAEDTAEELREAVEKKFPDCEIEMYEGGQPVYYYLLSVE